MENTEKKTTPVPNGFSSSRTGIPEQVTPTYTIKGVPQRGNISKIIIDVDNDTIETIWKREFLDNEGNPLDAVFKSETAFVRDIPEQGEAELNEATGFPKMETYKKLKDEKLTVTNWYKQLGRIIFIPAIQMVKEKAGYSTPTE